MSDLDRFLAEDCPECETPGFWRHLSAVGGCETCAANDPRPVHIYPVRNKHAGIRAYDAAMVPQNAAPSPWTPFRNRMPRTSRCYRLASGSMVHVKPDCRCG